MTRFFIENYKFTLVLSFAVAIFGLGGILVLKPEAFPDVNMGTVIINTYYDGATAQDIETKITKPIEDEIRSVRGIKSVKSVSQMGFSTITTQVDIDRYPVDEVVEDLQRAVDRVTDLPADLPNPPSFLEVKTDEFPVIEVAVVGSNENRRRDLVADLLYDELEDNPKISGIDFTGFTERQFNIEVDPEKLKLFHVGINEVVSTIQSRNLTIPGGALEFGDTQKSLKIDGKVESIEDLKNLLIRSNFSGQRVLLSDIATVTDGAEDADTLAAHNGRDATLLTIKKKAGENLIELAEEVRIKIEAFSAKYPDLEFTIYNNEGRRVANRIDVLSANAFIGLILVIGFLFIFLPGRVGIMAAISLPLAVLTTFGVMYVAGLTLNTITILAMVIAIGMLVDNAVVIAENFSRLRNGGLTPLDAATKSIQELWAPVTATALTTIAAFLPMLVTSGPIGQFIKGIPIVVTIALVISLFESFFLLPMRLAAGRKAGVQREQKQDWFSRLVIPRFDGLMDKLIRFRYIVLVGFGAILAGSIYLIVFGNKLILFPAEQTEIYLARVEMPSGYRIESTTKTVEQLSREIKDKLGDSVLHIAAKVGTSQENPVDPIGRRGQNVALAFIFMTEEAKNTLKTNSVLEKLREIPVPGSENLQYSAMINGPPVGAPVTVTFRSNNGQQLAELTEKIRQKLAGTEGVIDVRIDDIYEDREVAVGVDYASVSRVGLNLQSLGNTLRVAISGMDVSDINLDNKQVDLFVRYQDSSRTEIPDLKDVRIMDRTGNLIPVSNLVNFKDQDGAPQIKRYDFKRAKTVTGNVNDDIITAAAANQIAEKEFMAMQKDYPDVAMEFGGEGEQIAESMQSLAIALILSLIGIFSLLVLIFNSFLKPVIILTTIPLGLVGFAVAFFLQGRPISFLAMIGIVGLGGIIVNSGIVLISFIENMRKDSSEPLHTILVKSAGLRLRAVIVTSLTTVSGLLPTAYGIGGADEFIIPMTMSLAWGLTSGTILALLWVPCAYMILEDFEVVLRWATRRKKAPAPLKQAVTAE